MDINDANDIVYSYHKIDLKYLDIISVVWLYILKVIIRKIEKWYLNILLYIPSNSLAKVLVEIF